MAAFLCVVLYVLMWTPKPTAAFPQHDRSECREGLEYRSGNICCLNCPAGTRLTSACTRAGTKGTCEECTDGTFMEHSSNMDRCLPCTFCRPIDQNTIRPCTHTHNAECECISGRFFCDPDGPCEVCKKCSSCKKDEEIVRNCTPTSNTQCKKIQLTHFSESVTVNLRVIVPLVVVAVLLIAGIITGIWIHRRATGSQRNLADGRKSGQRYDDCPTDESGNRETQKPSFSSLIPSRPLVRVKSSAGTEDRKVLYESLNSSATNSQHSLTGLCSAASPATPPRASPTAPRQPNTREDTCVFPKLVPAKGEESLRKCFEYFEEIDLNLHKRFFRHLELGENMIKSKEHLHYDDKIHELLCVWMEKEGKEANLNVLLDALLVLNQRRTAETIKEKAIANGHYFESQ